MKVKIHCFRVIVGDYLGDSCVQDALVHRYTHKNIYIFTININSKGIKGNETTCFYNEPTQNHGPNGHIIHVGLRCIT